MENESNSKAHLTNYFLIIAFAFICSITLLIPLFPFLSLSSISIIFSTFVFFKSKRDILNYILFGICLLLSICTVLYANYFVTALNLIALVWSFSIMSLGIKEKSINYFLAPFTLLFKTFNTENKYKINFQDLWKSNKTKLHNDSEIIGQIVLGLFISIVLILIIVPLLANSNIIFKDYLTNIGNFFLAFKDLEIFSLLNFGRLILFLFFGFVLFPKFFSYINFNNTAENNFDLNTRQQQNLPKPDYSTINFITLIPKILISFILIIFFISQIQLYFANSEYLLELNKNYGNLNNEIFSQLLAVCLITFSISFWDRTQNSYHKISSFLLIGLSLFLTFIAFKSDLEYVSHYGITFKRLWGFVLLLLVFNSFMINIFKIVKNLNTNKAFEMVLLNSLILLIIVNFINFDRLIFNNMPHAKDNNAKKDYTYYDKLTINAIDLSTIYKKQQIEVEKYIKEHKITNEQHKITDENKYDLQHKYDGKINYLINKYMYQNLFDRICSFNLVEYLAFKNIENYKL